MSLENVKIGFAVTGSFCTIAAAIEQMKILKELNAELYPIVSYNVLNHDTRFGKSKDIIEKIEQICERKVIKTIDEAEPIGPKNYLDIIVVAPCTGNTLAKISQGITDTPVTMACKAQLRNGKNIVISVATNDALGSNFKNIGLLFNMKNIFFVPFGQDSPESKTKSIVSDMSRLKDACEAALKNVQIQPVIITL